jgi:hypothetical protein
VCGSFPADSSRAADHLGPPYAFIHFARAVRPDFFDDIRETLGDDIRETLGHE